MFGVLHDKTTLLRDAPGRITVVHEHRVVPRLRLVDKAVVRDTAEELDGLFEHLDCSNAWRMVVFFESPEHAHLFDNPCFEL